jgi:hypothetical protein
MLSIVVAIFLYIFLVNFWYMQPLDIATGVTTIFLLVLGVDVVIGPLLTLLVYKVGKKTLKMDLVVIVFLQLCALVYGMFVISQGRPAWLVYNVGRFDVVRLNELDLRKIDQAPQAYQTVSWLSPQWVSAVAPFDPVEKSDITLESTLMGIDIAQRPNLYRPLETQYDEIKKYLKPITELNDYNSPARVHSVLAKYPKADYWLPMKGTHRDMTVLIRRDPISIVKIVDLRPWND